MHCTRVTRWACQHHHGVSFHTVREIQLVPLTVAMNPSTEADTAIWTLDSNLLKNRVLRVLTIDNHSVFQSLQRELHLKVLLKRRVLHQQSLPEKHLRVLPRQPRLRLVPHRVSSSSDNVDGESHHQSGRFPDSERDKGKIWTSCQCGKGADRPTLPEREAS